MGLQVPILQLRLLLTCCLEDESFTSKRSNQPLRVLVISTNSQLKVISVDNIIWNLYIVIIIIISIDIITIVFVLCRLWLFGYSKQKTMNIEKQPIMAKCICFLFHISILHLRPILDHKMCQNVCQEIC